MSETYEAYRDEWDESSDEDEGSAINGSDGIGSGYDCWVRRAPRKGEYIALVYHVATKTYGMTYGFLEPDEESTEEEEMQRLARGIAGCPEDILWEKTG